MKNQLTKTITRRKLLITSGAAAGVAALAACAPAPTAAPAPAAPAATVAAAAPVAPKAPDPTKAPPPAPAAAPTVAVGQYGTGANPTVIWHGLGGADGAVFAKMLASYAEQGADYTVRSETYDWDVFFQKFPTAVAAGTPPDMAIFHAAEVTQMASQGIIQPLDDLFFKASNIDKGDFNKGLMNVLTIGGKTMAAPFDNHGWGGYVNTKVIKDAGLDPATLPKNGDEFIKFALKVVKDDAGKHPDEAGFNADKTKVWALHFSWPRFTMPSTWIQFGGGPFDPATNKATLDSEKSVAAVQYWYDLMYKYKVVPPALPGMPGAYDFMKTNSLAIMWDGSWSLGFFKDNPELEKVTVGVPLNSLSPDGKQGQKIDSHIMAIAVGAKPDQIARAVKLMTWLSNNGKTWATSGQIPARLSVQGDPAVQGIWSVKSNADGFNRFGRTEFPHKSFIEIQTAWEAAVGAALAKTTPVKEALTAGNKVIQAILDRG